MKIHILSNLHLNLSGLNFEFASAATQNTFHFIQMPSAMILKNTAILCAIFLMTEFASATAFTNCQSSQNQVDLGECMESEFVRTDEALNDIYREYSLSLSDEQGRQFAETQHAWRKFMELSCDFESSGMVGGSLQTTIQANCRSRLTRERIEDIEFLGRCAIGSHNCWPK